MPAQRRNISIPEAKPAFETAVALYWDKLFGIAVAKTNRQDAFDLLQDVLLAAWEKWAELPHDDSLEFYLLHALKLRIFNYYRTTGRYHAHLQKLEALLDRTVEDAAVLEEKELRGVREALLKEAVDQLSPALARIFSLRVREQYSYQQIGITLDIDPGSARVLYSRALKQVKKYIESNPSYSVRLVSAFMLFTIS